MNIEDEKHFEMDKDLGAFYQPQEHTIFDDNPYHKQIMLCHDCSLLFKKSLDAFWKK